jgi:hypothetical protein
MVKISKNVKMFLIGLVVLGFIATMIIYKPAKISNECCELYCSQISEIGMCLMQSGNQVICGLDYTSHGQAGIIEKVVFQFDDPVRVCRGLENAKSMGQNQSE